MFSVITDTSSNLDCRWLKENNVTVIPFHYFVDEKDCTCTDTEGFDGASFYAAMRAGQKVTTSQITPQAYLDALEALKAENPSIRKPLSNMRFIRFDGRQVVVEFDKKGMMDKMLLERKKPVIEAALAERFGQPVSVMMTIEGSGAAEKKVSDAAKSVINQAYDVFGREKTSVED